MKEISNDFGWKVENMSFFEKKMKNNPIPNRGLKISWEDWFMLCQSPIGDWIYACQSPIEDWSIPNRGLNIAIWVYKSLFGLTKPGFLALNNWNSFH